MNLSISDADIHAYVDGRLAEAGRQAVERYLAQHPERAAEVRDWQRDAQQLRVALGAGPALADNPALDPARIRMRQRQRRHVRLAWVAMLVMCLGLGGLGGWQIHDWRQARLDPPMRDAVQAYRLFAAAGPAHFDVVPHAAGEVQAWLDRHFVQAPVLPDLHAAGYEPIGGRLLATDSGPAAMVLYANARGGAISFYLRPPSVHGLLPRGQRRDDELVAMYGSGGGYNYALVGHADARIVATMRRVFGS